MTNEVCGYNQWTEELVRETSSNFESLEGVDSVEWITAPSNANIIQLIRVRTRSGNVIRLAITCYTEYGSAVIFDDSFDESAC